MEIQVDGREGSFYHGDMILNRSAPMLGCMVAIVSSTFGEDSADAARREVVPDIVEVQSILRVLPEKGLREFPIRILDDRKLLLCNKDLLTEYIVTLEDGALSVEEYRHQDLRRGSRGTYSLKDGVWVWTDDPGEKAVRRYRVPSAVKEDFLRQWRQKILKDLRITEEQAYAGISIAGPDELHMGMMTGPDGSRNWMSCVCQWKDGKWEVVLMAC